MLAAISHDLRAPLARLRLRAELVEDGEQQAQDMGWIPRVIRIREVSASASGLPDDRT
jgi:signal transduction histidine kinase